MSEHEQENLNINILKSQLKRWRELAYKHLPPTKCDRDDVAAIDELLSNRKINEPLSIKQPQTKFSIIHGYPSEVVQDVNEKLSDGYQLYGELMQFTTRSGHTVFAQGVVKQEPNTNSRKIVNLKTIGFYDQTKFVDSINEAIEDGYELVGPITVKQEPVNKYHSALMIKYEK